MAWAISPASPIAQLAAAAETETVAADGTDICYVNVSVRDAEGLVVPDAKMPVTFAIDGPGEIVATDNGDETDFSDFRSCDRKTFNGWAQAIVRPRNGAKGVLRLTAKSNGIESGSTEIVIANH